MENINELGFNNTYFKYNQFNLCMSFILSYLSGNYNNKLKIEFNKIESNFKMLIDNITISTSILPVHN